MEISPSLPHGINYKWPVGLASIYFLEKLSAFSSTAMGSYLDKVGKSNHSETGESSPDSIHSLLNDKVRTKDLDQAPKHMCVGHVGTHKKACGRVLSQMWACHIPIFVQSLSNLCLPTKIGLGVSPANLCPIFVPRLRFGQIWHATTS